VTRELILVVDDDEDSRDTIAEVVSLYGFAVIGVANGEQALGALAATRPTLVITDLEMPIRDGQSLIAAMRTHERARTVTVLVVTAKPDEAPDGVVAIAKPFDLETLTRAIRKALKASGDEEGVACAR
jgi:DNA-binding response OmpR family regulator